jgi:hypothetical protein
MAVAAGWSFSMLGLHRVARQVRRLQIVEPPVADDRQPWSQAATKTDRPAHAPPTRPSRRPNADTPNCSWCITSHQAPAGLRPRLSRRARIFLCDGG